MGTYLDHNKLNKYYQEICIRGVTYKIGSVIPMKLIENEAEFGEIVKIVCNTSNIYFYVNVYKEEIFNAHYHAYLIKKCDYQLFIKYEDLPFLSPCSIVKKDSDEYLAANHIL